MNFRWKSDENVKKNLNIWRRVSGREPGPLKVAGRSEVAF